MPQHVFYRVDKSPAVGTQRLLDSAEGYQAGSFEVNGRAVIVNPHVSVREDSGVVQSIVNQI